MTNHGDDCYFYYYSTCTKGDKCPFRHCEAAMGNEVVCNLWQEGRCFRTVCKFRHMEITKKRKEIPCYWETHPSGCKKPHCAFFHDKPRYIEGAFVPPDKGIQMEERPLEEPPAQLQTTTLPATVNPQLRGVKTEGQDPVPSPTHPPVVINPAEDDEDEDDQYSEEGEDGKFVPSPRKMLKLDDPLNFGVSTLEEIRLRKTLKTNMMRQFPAQWTVSTVNGEKENLQSLFRASSHGIKDECFTFEGKGGSRGSVIDRLGRKLPHANLESEGVPLKRSLADRLGKVVDEAPSSHQTGSLSQGAKQVEDMRIKTLDEIKKDKAAKTHNQITSTSLPFKGVRRGISVKEDSIGHVKTFSEIIQAKKKKREEQDQGCSPTKIRKQAEKTSCTTHEKLDLALNNPVAAKREVRVKTLEEIRREKAARIQKTQEDAIEEESDVKNPCLLSTKTLSNNGVKMEKNVERGVLVKDSVVSEVTPDPSKDVKVKTFEEIMREKSLRRQELAYQASSSSQTTASAETGQKPLAAGNLKRNVTTNSPSAPPRINTHNLPVCKLLIADSKVISPLVSTVPAWPVSQNAAIRQADTQTQSLERCLAPKLSKQSSITFPASKIPLCTNQMKSPEPKPDIKVRPKLNVKPSVMKPALQVRPGAKRKAAAVHSAVAAVKPLGSSPTLEEDIIQIQRPAKPSSGAVTRPGAAVLHCNSPLREEAHMVPVVTASLEQDTKLPADATGDTFSSTIKSPTQTKTRRQSMPSSREGFTSCAAPTSAVDDFEDLINEFADSEYEEDVDPGIGEDDLLQELSDMIDS